MIVFGVITALAILSNTFLYNVELFSTYNFLMLASFVLLSGIAFFLPLYALTQSMRDAKQKLLQSITERYSALNEKYGSGAADLQDLNNEQVADLKALKSQQQTAHAMQVWPFNRGSLIRYTCATATPLLIILIAIALFR